MATTELAPKHDLPAILQDAGNAAAFAAEEFFEARLANEHTRRAYGRYVRNFLERCEAEDLALREITPGDAARFIRDLQSVSTKKVALAALRRFFDLLVTRHVVMLNPFASVRGPRQPAGAGRTPEITVAQARQLLDSIDTTHLAGLRDRAVIGTLTYTGARVGALSQLRLQDLRDYGDHRTLCFREKGGKRREIPVRIDLDRWLADYLAAGRLEDEPKNSPLLRPLDIHDRSRLASRSIYPQLIRDLLKRRLRDAGLPTILTPHSCASQRRPGPRPDFVALPGESPRTPPGLRRSRRLRAVAPCPGPTFSRSCPATGGGRRTRSRRPFRRYRQCRRARSSGGDARRRPPNRTAPPPPVARRRRRRLNP